MITIKDFMELVEYRITEGSEYCWDCYGSNAYRLEYWNQKQNGHTVGIIFDTKTQEVYEAAVYDYKRERAYRIINPEYLQQYLDEAKQRSVLERQAWDDVDYVNLEDDADFLEKSRAILSDKDYDTRVQVPIDLSDNELFELMKMAHDRDITLNQMVESILQTVIDEKSMRDEYDFSKGERGPVDKSIKKIKEKKSES